jgi:hypothetical protein
MGTEDPKVPNPYLAAIRARKASSEGAAGTLRSALDKAVKAMDAGAWSGGKADDFYSGLTQRRTTASNAADNGMAEFDDAINGIVSRGDEKVDPNSWYCHWHNLRAN